MRVPRCSGAGCVTIMWGLLAVAGPGAAWGDDSGAGAEVVRQDRVVAGGPGDFMEVRHLVLEGSHADIGRALATIGQERYGSFPIGSEPLRNRAKQAYMKGNYPILYERMKGAAEAFGLPLDDDDCDFSTLWYAPGVAPGCSVVYTPPGLTEDGLGVVSRNFEFHTGDLEGGWPAEGEPAMFARPYVIEMHPEGGFASLAVCSNELMSTAFDGINSEGLTVTALADDGVMRDFPTEPAEGSGVGLAELQVPRMLLDTCATVEEAKEALLRHKQYYDYLPCHYLIADRHGEAFVWEYSHVRNREYIIEDPGRPLISTNFSLHRHLDGDRPPSAEAVAEVCPRYRLLASRMATEGRALSADAIKAIHGAVDATHPGSDRPPTRTLWHSLYIPEARSLRVSFYLGESPDPDEPGGTRIVRSEAIEFTLEHRE